MRNKIGIWAIVGFMVAGFWAVYTLAATPPAFSSADPLLLLVRLTCPIAFLSFLPIKLYWVLLANTATYALVGLIVESIRLSAKRAA